MGPIGSRAAEHLGKLSPFFSVLFQRGLVYWYFPDTGFVTNTPVLILMPSYDKGEHDEDIYRTAQLDCKMQSEEALRSSVTTLTKWAAGGIESAADKAVPWLKWRSFKASN